MKTLIVMLAIMLSLCGGAYASSCSFLPFKPFTPFGCRDLLPVCQCDGLGLNCAWTWICVR